jgi:branched-chain amino acid transport system permease protein
MSWRWVAAVAAGVLALALPWLVDSYVIAIAGQALAFAVLALSVHVHTGLAGLPTLGQGAYLGAGAYAAARLARDLHAPGAVQLVVAAAVGGLAALVAGAAVIRTRGVVTVMLTLAIAELVHTTAVQWKAVTGGSDGLSVPATSIWPGGSPLVLDGYVYLWLLVVAGLAMAFVVVLGRSPYGLALVGAADHEARMRASGFPVDRLLWTAQIWSGLLAGLAGGMWVAAHRYVSPADLDLTVSVLALVAVVIGGTGSAVGAVVGAVLVVAVDDLAGQSLTGVWAGHGALLLGIVFVGCVYLLPAGVVRARRRRVPAPDPPSTVDTDLDDLLGSGVATHGGRHA